MSSSGAGVSAGELDARVALFQARWLRAVDMLWRETVVRRLCRVEDSRRAGRRARNLRRIVGKALSEYHRIELERQRLDEPVRRC